MNKNHLKLIALSIVVIFILLTVVSSCTKGRPSHSINIRIQNISPLHMDNFWLGSSPEYGATEITAFGEIPSMNTSEYKQVEPVIYNYDASDFVSNGVRYLDSPSTKHYRKVLEFGLIVGEYYTFTYDVIDGKVELTITHDEDAGKEN